MKKVRIDIFDSHINETDDDTPERESSEMSIFGNLEETDEGYVISYTELEGEFAGCSTVLNVKKDCVTITKSGDYKYDFMLEANKRHSCNYSTPYGSFIIGLMASEIKLDKDDDSLNLLLRYSIDCNSSLLSQNELNIKVRELI